MCHEQWALTVIKLLRFFVLISYITQSAARCLYGLKTLHAHGLAGKSLWDVTQATLIARILYAAPAPACWRFLNAAEKGRIESVINKAQRYGYLSSSFENVHNLVDNVESKLFNRILSNPRHVLYELLPREKDTGYSLRPRSHHLTLPFTDNNMIRKNFLHRKLFMDTY